MHKKENKLLRVLTWVISQISDNVLTVGCQISVVASGQLSVCLYVCLSDGDYIDPLHAFDRYCIDPFKAFKGTT